MYVCRYGRYKEQERRNLRKLRIRSMSLKVSRDCNTITGKLEEVDLTEAKISMT